MQIVNERAFAMYQLRKPSRQIASTTSNRGYTHTSSTEDAKRGDTFKSDAEWYPTQSKLLQEKKRGQGACLLLAGFAGKMLRSSSLRVVKESCGGGCCRSCNHRRKKREREICDGWYLHLYLPNQTALLGLEIQLGQPFLDTSENLWIGFRFDFLRPVKGQQGSNRCLSCAFDVRFPYGVRPFLLATVRAYLLPRMIQGRALVTDVSNPTAWLLPDARLRLAWWFGITGISVGVFLELGSGKRVSISLHLGHGHPHVRITGTFLAADVLALLTLCGLSKEQGATPVAGAADPLPDGLADQVLATRARGNGEQGSLALLGARFVGRRSSSLGLGLCLGLLLLLGLGRRVARTLLAARVVAADADLVRTKGRLAVVAGATDPHADRLLHALDVQVAGVHPLLGLEGQAILGEHGTGSLLLHSTPVRGQGGGRHGGRAGRGRRLGGLLGGRDGLGTVFEKISMNGLS